MPKVSVCVPIYNVERFIKRCIESILNQTLTDIEIIIVNDCTLDGSMQIVEKYAKNDCRIKIIDHERNRGLMWARRTGYMSAKGDYITFCDSDDTLALDAVELLYNEALRTNADIIAGNIRYISVDGKEKELQNILSFGSDKESVYRSLLHHEFGHNVCSKMFKRELLQDYTYQTFEQFINGEDGCLFYQVVENSNKTVTINKSIYNYYQNIESSTQVKLSEIGIKSIVFTNKIRVEICSKYPQLNNVLYRFVFNVLFDQLILGYGSITRKYVSEYNLKRFLEIKEARKYFSNLELIKFFLRKIYRTIRG